MAKKDVLQFEIIAIDASEIAMIALDEGQLKIVFKGNSGTVCFENPGGILAAYKAWLQSEES